MTAATTEVVLDGKGTVVPLLEEGRKYITGAPGSSFYWSTAEDSPYHHEHVLSGIDLPNIPMYVKSLGQKVVLTVTVYDS